MKRAIFSSSPPYIWTEVVTINPFFIAHLSEFMSTLSRCSVTFAPSLVPVEVLRALWVQLAEQLSKHVRNHSLNAELD